MTHIPRAMIVFLVAAPAVLLFIMLFGRKERPAQ
jgi:hypothetical protein